MLSQIFLNITPIVLSSASLKTMVHQGNYSETKVHQFFGCDRLLMLTATEPPSKINCQDCPYATGASCSSAGSCQCKNSQCSSYPKSCSSCYPAGCTNCAKSCICKDPLMNKCSCFRLKCTIFFFVNIRYGQKGDCLITVGIL